jgi:hypothetical protein
MELDFCPHLYSDTWPFVLVPVVLPQLRTKMNEVYRSCVASLSLSPSKFKFRLQHVFDVLDIISNGSLMVKLVKTWGRLTFEVERVTFSAIFGWPFHCQPPMKFL